MPLQVRAVAPAGTAPYADDVQSIEQVFTKRAGLDRGGEIATRGATTRTSPPASSSRQTRSYVRSCSKKRKPSNAP